MILVPVMGSFQNLSTPVPFDMGVSPRVYIYYHLCTSKLLFVILDF